MKYRDAHERWGKYNIAPVVILLCLTVRLVVSFSSGNVAVSCGSMRPFHLPFRPVSGPDVPYNIQTSRNKDGSINVTLAGIYKSYKGFMLRAEAGLEEVIGRFTAIPEAARLLDCGYGGSTVSHNGSIEKKSLNFKWDPEGYIGPIIFRASVVESYLSYWTDVETSYFV